MTVWRLVTDGVADAEPGSRSVVTEARFGGFKQSGLGREMGMHAAALYTEVKNVSFWRSDCS